MFIHWRYVKRHLYCCFHPYLLHYRWFLSQLPSFNQCSPNTIMNSTSVLYDPRSMCNNWLSVNDILISLRLKLPQINNYFCPWFILFLQTTLKYFRLLGQPSSTCLAFHREQTLSAYLFLPNSDAGSGKSCVSEITAVLKLGSSTAPGTTQLAWHQHKHSDCWAFW